MKHEEIITNFYTAFARGNHQDMIGGYHSDIVFEDPAFGKLAGKRVGKMWEMLLSQKEANLKIKFSNVRATDLEGSADWEAVYVYSSKKRKVVNQVHAKFTFKEGKIVTHVDSFNLWKWSKQVLGTIGFLMGWTPFMKVKIQGLANKRLDDFIKKSD